MGRVRESFASRLREAMLKRGCAAQRGGASGVDVVALADAAGVSYQMARRYVLGTALPDPERIATIAEWLKVSLPWLRDGISDVNITQGNLAQGPRFSARVPVLTAEAVGALAQGRKEQLADEWVSVETAVGLDAFAYVVQGDIMVDADGKGFPDGCRIVADPARTPQSGDYVVMVLAAGDRPIFRQLWVDGPHTYLRPLNPRYPVIQVTSPPKLCAVVVESHMVRRFY